MFKHTNKTTDKEFQMQSGSINSVTAKLTKGKDTKIVFENYSDKKRLILEFENGILTNTREETK